MKKNSRTTEIGLADQVSVVLKTHSQAGAFFLLALSGGVDSIVLLHILHSLREKHTFQLHAMHVHHGLSAFADDWANHCQKVCADLNVPLNIVKVQLNLSKTGTEAAARTARYEALLAYCDESGRQPDFIVTAHHEQDQAETLLLQLSRGAGVRGLAAMPLWDTKKRLFRPMLKISKEKILAYADDYKLRWCEDDSNVNTAFERNFLRHEILPDWLTRHPALIPNLARSAMHLAEANDLLEALAQMDALPLINHNSLDLEGLKKLTIARAKNALRWWLSRHDIQMPNAEFLNEIIGQLFSAKPDAEIDIRLQSYSLKNFQGRVYLVKDISFETFEIVWHGEEKIQLPSGLLQISQLNHGKFFSPTNDQFLIRSRQGGERLKVAQHRPTRSLKYLMQEAGIPPWRRVTWPLVFLNGTLVCVPNIAVADSIQEKFHQAGLEFAFKPH